MVKCHYATETTTVDEAPIPTFVMGDTVTKYLAVLTKPGTWIASAFVITNIALWPGWPYEI